MKTEPYISVVVVSRNDDHGGNLLQRMQLFITGWLEQTRKYNLSSELIIVEWNPLPDRPRLAQTIKWPDDTGPCTVRILEVPTEIHRRFKYSDQLPVFQMIGKNVGIRRSRGHFVLATNIDILFSDEIMDYFASGKMETNRMYRIDRYDVMSDIPSTSLDEQFDFCRNHIIRINQRDKTQILSTADQSQVHNIPLTRALFKRVRAIRNMKGIIKLGNDTFLTFYMPLYRNIIQPFLYGKRLHTNACGDFTLMARERWLALLGYAEFQIYSMYLDGLTCMAAHCSGATEIVLEDPMRIYHIEHTPGSGWSPGVGAKLLEQRLEKAGIPQLKYKKYLKYLRWMHLHKRPVIFNDNDWGLANENLPETIIGRKNVE
jgi:hypothetical protein